MEDTLGKAKEQQGKFEQLISKLPFYKGYKEKELRRETDKLLRDDVARQLEVEWRRVADLQRQMLDGGMLIYVNDMQTVETRLRRFMDRVRGASYGYSGAANVTKVNEDTLDTVYNFDITLLNNVEAIKSGLDDVQAAIDAGEGVPAAIRKASNIVGIANDTFGEREKLMRGMA